MISVTSSFALYYQELCHAWSTIKERCASFLFLLPKITLASANALDSLRDGISSSANNNIEPTRKVVIIGSGPAGYTAAIYAARADLQPIVYEGALNENACPGGQLMKTTKVENYPGFPDGIDGPDLIDNMRKQALKAGATMIEENVDEVDFSKYPFKIRGQKTNNQAEVVIVATGATAKRLDIPGTRDHELWQRGVSSCAVCDGPLPIFRNRQVFIIGGGDSAMEEALFLSKFASKVFVVHRRDNLRASKAMQQAVLANPKIEILWNSVMSRVNGTNTVESVVIEHLKTKQKTTHKAGGVFFAIGHTPNTAFLKNQLALDPNGYIEVKAGFSETSIPHVYAAGDVKDRTYRQAITAAASGCMAAMDAERALANKIP